jgi:hypothetical protein
MGIPAGGFFAIYREPAKLKCIQSVRLPVFFQDICAREIGDQDLY